MIKEHVMGNRGREAEAERAGLKKKSNDRVFSDFPLAS